LDGNIYALDAASGEEQWRFETEEAFYASPVVVGQTIVIGSVDGTFYALREE
jgi:outer membrane protein assembly factor BamB